MGESDKPEFSLEEAMLQSGSRVARALLPESQRFSPAELQDKAQKFIQKEWRGGDYNCPICDHDVWEVGEPVMVRAFPPGRNESTKASVLVSVSCARCANTLFLNLVTAGILPRRKDDE